MRPQRTTRPTWIPAGDQVEGKPPIGSRVNFCGNDICALWE